MIAIKTMIVIWQTVPNQIYGINISVLRSTADVHYFVLFTIQIRIFLFFPSREEKR